jgi:preprotein translocase subunit SecD
MDRNWYLRLGVVLASVIGAFVVLWPSVSSWVPTPTWITEHVDRHIVPGLDIQGGLRMMYTVDMDSAIEDRRNARAQQILRKLGEKMDLVEEDEAPNEQQLSQIRDRVTAQMCRADPRVIRLEFHDAADLELVDRDFVRSFGDLAERSSSDRSITLVLTEQSIDELRDLAVRQAQETIKNRIAEMGLQEANVRAQDVNVVVEVPGASEEQFQRIRELISQTARLEFKIVDTDNHFVTTLADVPEGIERRGDMLYAAGVGACPAGVVSDTPDGDCTAHARLGHYVEQVRDSGRVPEGRSFSLGRVPSEEGEGESAGEQGGAWRTYVLYDQPPNGSDPVGGEHLDDASVGNDPQNGQPVVTFAMNAEGARRMQELTSSNIGKQMAIVLDNEVASAPVIRGRIGARGQIELGFGNYQNLLNEANDLVVVLRAGALPAPIIAQNEQYIGPTLGRDAVVAGTQGAIIGIGLVLLLMGVYYQVAGLVANVMVLINLLLLFGIMAFFNNDLTLPGIAGIALTVGMAVDANVLITERMREELRIGKSPRAAVEQGFKRAFSSIFDSQFTTFIAAVVLLQYGSPEIQGFGRTLMIGIITSLFTGVFCSKVMFDWLVRGLKVSRLRVG